MGKVSAECGGGVWGEVKKMWGNVRKEVSGGWGRGVG